MRCPLRLGQMRCAAFLLTFVMSTPHHRRYWLVCMIWSPSQDNSCTLQCILKNGLVVIEPRRVLHYGEFPGGINYPRPSMWCCRGEKGGTFQGSEHWPLSVTTVKRTLAYITGHHNQTTRITDRPIGNATPLWEPCQLRVTLVNRIWPWRFDSPGIYLA